MKTVRTVSEMRKLRREAQSAGLSTGLVPTMGFLHEGHLSLVRLASNHCDFVVVSIFVNPVQFGPGEDYAEYPRDEERDIGLCAKEGVDVVFIPDVPEMYCENSSVYVDETSLSKGLCGASRPGHFRGVATVVAKLLNIVEPDTAVFGRKDAQQARIIQRMSRDLNFPVRILLGDIVREPDGLAMSSRNRYLSKADRAKAVRLYCGLRRAESLYNGGEHDVSVLKAAVTDEIKGGANGYDDDGQIEIDYVEVVDWATLNPVSGVVGPALIAAAVRVGETRLIDNIILGCLSESSVSGD